MKEYQVILKMESWISYQYFKADSYYVANGFMAFYDAGGIYVAGYNLNQVTGIRLHGDDDWDKKTVETENDDKLPSEI